MEKRDGLGCRGNPKAASVYETMVLVDYCHRYLCLLVYQVLVIYRGYQLMAADNHIDFALGLENGDLSV